jgi:hypothetical protein
MLVRRAMGILEDKASGRWVTLGGRCLMGRHAACDLQIADARVSGEHASLHWLGDRWAVRDLGSRNGTFVDDRRLAAGERVALREGAVIALGGPKVAFALVDASAPRVSARRVRTGEVRGGTESFLALPDDDRPLASVFEDGRGEWVIEEDDAARRVRDHEPVSVDGETWILSLPVSHRETMTNAQAPLLEEVTLRLVVSRDEEHVEATIVHQDRLIPLPPRSFHYLLLTLARRRREDSAEDGRERGWVDRDDLCRMLGVDQLKLNTDICRLRKQLGEIGVCGAAGIVQRRAGSGQVRIGIDRIEITRG